MDTVWAIIVLGISLAIILMLLKRTFIGAVVLFGRAEEQGFLGLVAYIACWVFLSLIMVIICTIVGYMTDKGEEPDHQQAYNDLEQEHQDAHLALEQEYEEAKYALEKEHMDDDGYLDEDHADALDDLEEEYEGSFEALERKYRHTVKALENNT